MAVQGTPIPSHAAFHKGAMLRWYDSDDSNYAGLKPPSNITGSVDYQWPAAGPAVAGYGMASTTVGVLSWDLCGVPVGAILPWLDILVDSVNGNVNSPALPAQFVRCDGQTLSDSASPYNGKVIPNLNNHAGGGGYTADPNGFARFFRGAGTAGTRGGAETHTHTLPTTGICTGGGTAANTPTNSSNHLVPYYEVVWVLRIK